MYLKHILLNNLFLALCALVYVCVRVLNPLELTLQRVVSYHVKIEPGSPERTSSVLTC